MTKGGSILVAVLNGFTWLIQVVPWLLLTVCGAVDCKMAWLTAGLAVLGGSIGGKLLRTVAFFDTGFTFGSLF